MIAPARRAAHEVLRAVSTNRVDLSTALERSRLSLPDVRDRALASDIVLGVCRWRAALDHILGQLSTRPVEGIDEGVLDLLRAATYQLLYLDRVPAHAVVTDAVSLTREIRQNSAAGFVNAVLRSLAECRHPVTLPAPPAVDRERGIDRAAALDYLSVTASHPRWLAARWFDRYGWSATFQWAKFNNGPAPVVVRPVLRRSSQTELRTALAAHGVESQPTRLAPHGLAIRRGHPLTTPVAETGAFIIQEEAAQLIGELVPSAGDRPVLDLCAAPGGKTVGLADRREASFVVASDFRQRRVALLAQTLQRLQIPAVSVVRLDAEAPLPFGRVFGGALVDVPCSGLGTIGRNPDIRWRRTEDQLERLAARQLKLLVRAASVLRPDGWLVYATCSSEPEENEEVVRRFLDTDRTWSISPPTAASVGSLVDEEGCLRTLPFRDGTDAFFGAILKRRIA